MKMSEDPIIETLQNEANNKAINININVLGKVTCCYKCIQNIMIQSNLGQNLLLNYLNNVQGS